MNKKRRTAIAANQISRLETFYLGGFKQKVLIEGKNAKNPVLIFLHGGPGTPIPFSAGCRGMFPEFSEHFIMVYWDQLGCGINNYPIDDSFRIRMFVDMTVDLISAVHQEFPDNQLILFGISWGSVLAVKASYIVPEMIDNVLVYGQILKNLLFNQEACSILQKAKLTEKHRNQLRSITQKNVLEFNDIQIMAGLIRKYTEGYQAKSKESISILPLLSGLLTSPDYSFKDFTALYNNGYSHNVSLWQELIRLDLSCVLENTQIPYRILQGSTDIVTSTKAIWQFVEEGSNPLLSIRIIEGNGHIPSPDGMESVLKEAKQLIR